jgi:hypothetical protein
MWRHLVGCRHSGGGCSTFDGGTLASPARIEAGAGVSHPAQQLAGGERTVVIPGIVLPSRNFIAHGMRDHTSGR